MNVMTDNERPAFIDKVWFRARYGQNFPDLLDSTQDDFLNNCINDIYTLFYGVGDLWSHLDREVYVSKTQMCYGLLVAWYIADLFPTYAVGIVSSGGVNIKEKRIGGTTIKFGDIASTKGSVNNADLLQSLKSNAFGAKAYMMIKTCGKINLFLQR